MLFLNTVLQNRYRIIRQLGQGGMGTVYEALDQRVSALVALKETVVADNEEARRAFEREAALLANLRHQSLPKVTDYFIEGGGEYLVMEYIHGYDLAELLALRGAPFEVQRVLAWADELLKVLEYLHVRATPILHRDIKPSNLKLTKEGELFLLDFGLAKGAAGQMPTLLTSRSVRGYTRVYASLEQIQGKRTDIRSDLYSLGATLYHLLTNVPPVDAPTRDDALEDENPDPLPPVHELNPQVHPAISAVVGQAMAVSRKHRYGSAKEMRFALRQAWEEAHKAEELRLHLEAEKKRYEQEQRHLAEQEEARRLAEDERRVRAAEEEARRRAAIAEEAERRRAEEERRRIEAEYQRRREEEEEAARLREEQEQRRIEEQAKRLAEEERKRVEEETRQREVAEAARRQREQEEAEQRRRTAERQREGRRAEILALTAPSSPDILQPGAQPIAGEQPQATQGSKPADVPLVSTLKVARPERSVSDALSTEREATVRSRVMGVAKNPRIVLPTLIGLVWVAALITVALVMRPRQGEGQAPSGNQATSTRPAEPSGTPTLPAGMVYVLGGAFTMGRDEKDGGDEYERPAHSVMVKPFFIDIYEVTNAEYAMFVKARNYRPPSTWTDGAYRAADARKPVTGVTWDDANAYAEWVGKRLPTEEEWEYAARGADGRLYPWGNRWGAGLANADGASRVLANVGKYKGASPFGAFDMVGNAWEWTASVLSSYSGERLPVVASKDTKVIRGGSYTEKRTQATTTYRGFLDRESDNNKKTGFRCIRYATPAPAP
ncbi:MAG TPA: bifunctional serine/threonine-protein kinase/formylglycine-generating enzyme family protein [Pyrinomonadaceae bacterium]|jgi:formylglycine-generating enzyme required for sulfatase activity